MVYDRLPSGSGDGAVIKGYGESDPALIPKERMEKSCDH